MKRAFKITLIALGGLASVVGALVGYVELTHAKDYGSIPLPAIVASKDPAIIAQGEYVANAIAHCSACHGPAEQASKHELGPRHDLSGGFVMEAGPFGTYIPANITPDAENGIGRLSDGLLARAIRHGVDRNGKYAPLMAFAVGPLSDEDLMAVVSYLRSVPARPRRTPPDTWGFLAKALASQFKPKTGPSPKHVASGGISVARGEYLANGPAFCVGCHTEVDPFNGFAFAKPKFSGAVTAEPDRFDPEFEFVSANLTPDPETGYITTWTEDRFVERFRSGGAYRGSIMPWDNFKQMTDDDLRSIYRYLRSLPPIKNVTGPLRRPAGWKPD